MSYWRMIWLAMMVWTIQVHAQRRLVVVDVETLLPVVGANVISKDGSATTDSLGYISVSDSCKSLSFSHVNYESRLVNLKELNDTVFLISKLLNIKEVVVFGHGQRNELPEALKRQMKIDKKEAQLAAIDPSSGGNLLSLIGNIIPKKWRKNSKEERRRRLQKIIEEY
ncbi:MAG: hypothetical protein II866_11800 [Prevotella sp.]|nr:hypothetical protein [Prevotella sp.]